MWSNLPEIKKVFKTIVKETDQLQKLSERVDELLCDEIIKDFTLYKYKKDINQTYFEYEVKEDDFKHITDNLCLIQRILQPTIVVMAQTDGVDSYKILFRKG